MHLGAKILIFVYIFTLWPGFIRIHFEFNLRSILMTEEVKQLWPELDWIEDTDLRERTAKAWEIALERSVLSAEDLNTIPFTLLVPDLKVTFMTHKRAVVHIALESGKKMNEFFKNDLPVNMDILISGAILADVGKLLEYELKDGKAVQGNYGKYLRHPFSGVSLAEEAGLPAEVCHIIAAHAGEGNMIKLSINESSSLPIHSQLKRSILLNILSGKLEDGGKMPSIRSLAKILKVNPNTVAKVYYNLEEEGLLDGKAGSGFTIKGNRGKLDDFKSLMIEEEIKNLLETAVRLGIGKKELLELIGRIIENG